MASFKNNGKLKLLIIVGTRPEIIRLSEVIKRSYENGALFDAWSEHFKSEAWDAAFEECDIDRYFYIGRERSTDEILPWDFIDMGVTKAFLKREWERAKAGILTKNCAEECQGCGAARYGTGICKR